MREEEKGMGERGGEAHKGTSQLPQTRTVRNSVRRGPKGSTLITDRRKCKNKGKTFKCHFLTTDTPLKAQVNTCCPEVNLLVGLLSYKEAVPHAFAGKWVLEGNQGPEKDACNVDTHSMGTRESGPLGILNLTEASERLKGCKKG